MGEYVIYVYILLNVMLRLKLSNICSSVHIFLINEDSINTLYFFRTEKKNLWRGDIVEITIIFFFLSFGKKMYSILGVFKLNPVKSL